MQEEFTSCGAIGQRDPIPSSKHDKLLQRLFIVFPNLTMRLLDTTYIIKHHEIKMKLEASSLLISIHRASILCTTEKEN